MKTNSTANFHPVSAPDFLPPEQLQALQLQRLQGIVQRAYNHVALFRKRMDDAGLKPTDVRSLDDVTKLPFTVKTDLRDTYPFGLFASSMKDIVRLHASTGTTGKPIVVAYTKEDIDVWSNVMMRSFAACGLHAGDVIQNAYGYGLFTGGLGAHYGGEALGATVIPISGGNTQRQLMVMKDFGSTAICCTPSYFLHIIEQAPELGVKLKELPLRVGVFGAEPWTESMRRRIEAESGIKAYDITALTSEKCECGRTLRRIQRIGRRSDDMFIIRGVNVYPSQIETALLKVEGTLPHYQIILTREKGLDEVEVQVEVTKEVFGDTVGVLEEVQRNLGHSIETLTGLRMKVRMVQPQTIQRSEGKAKRVLDQRKM